MFSPNYFQWKWVGSERDFLTLNYSHLLYHILYNFQASHFLGCNYFILLFILYRRQVRNQVMFSNTLFYCLSYGGPNMCHIITSGTDRKISYWETLDGSLIRELDGAITGAVLAMDISPDGNFFVTGGEEKLVKVSGQIVQ